MSKLGKWLVGLALVGLFGLLTPGKASASGIYDITGTLSDGYGDSLTFTDSTVTIASSGLATGSTIDLEGSSSLMFSGVPNITNTSTEYTWGIDEFPFYTSVLDLQGNFAGLGTTGTADGSYYFEFIAYGQDYYTGDVTLTDAPAGTPEPSTLLMLGAGLLGLFATAGLLSKSKLNMGLNQVA